MKTKKVIITSIIAMLLLAGLLFYWNNNEVHACEAVSLEEAREILREDNLLLEYNAREDEEEEWTYKRWLLTWNERVEATLVICKDGSVYYCSFEGKNKREIKSVYNNISDGWEYVPSSLFYLGKLSTIDTWKLNFAIFLSGERDLYEEKYRDLNDVEPDSMNLAENNAEKAMQEGEYELFFLQHNNPIVQHFLDRTLHECYYFTKGGYGLSTNDLHYKMADTVGIEVNQQTMYISTFLHESSFFEQYAIMALDEIYTRRNPVIDVASRFVYEESVPVEGITFQPFYVGGSLVSDNTDMIYIDNGGLITGILREGMLDNAEYVLQIPLSAQMLLLVDGRMYCSTGWFNKELYIWDDDQLRLLTDEYNVGEMQTDGEYLYCTDYNSLLRISNNGDMETLWEHAVYGFTVDENHIYIFDGNTWQVLDRESGEDLGWISTNIHFNYEPGEVYASGGRLFFNAWNPEEQTVSVNSLDMEGNLEQIGTSHRAFEGDLECVTAYGDYLYYATGNGSVIVRVNVRTGEERLIPIAEYVIYINDVLIVEDCLLVYGSDQNWNAHLVCFDLETLEYEGMVCLE